MSDFLPDPLTPPECDLRDLPSMLLDVVRLRDSELAASDDPEAFRCAVLSWCASWHQLPAGSLPDDERVIARLCGYGRDVESFRHAREAGGLRGWHKCSDGRLYHPVVAEKAKELWERKLAQRARTEAARDAKRLKDEQQRNGQTVTGQPQADPPSATGAVTTSVTETVTTSNEREGKVREERKEEPASQGAAAPAVKPTQITFLPPEPKPEPTPHDLLFWTGLPILARLSDKPADSVRSWLSKLEKIAGPEIVLATILDCEKSPPKGSPFAWIRGCAEAEAKRRKGPVLVVNNAPADPDDLYGVNAWCASLPGVKPSEESDRPRGKWDYGGRLVDFSAKQIATAARFSDSWRGSWDMLREWIDAGIPTATIVASVGKCVANWDDYDPKRIASLSAFDAWVRPKSRNVA